MNKEFLAEQRDFMLNEKSKKSLKMNFCSENNLMFMSWQSDYSINLIFYDMDNELVKYKQSINLKSIELNIPVTPYSIKFSR